MSKLWLRLILCTCLAAWLIPPSPAAAGRWVQHAGECYAINAPGRIAGEKISLEEAMDLVAQYRWIYVNASLKDLNEAQSEATKLSDALNKRPAVLVYMPRHIGDGQRNDYNPAFQQSLAALIRHGLQDGKELLVAARSYGVHQCLRVVVQFNSPKILLLGIAPAFGAFGNQASDNVRRYVQDLREVRSKVGLIASRDDGFTFNAGGSAYRKRSGIIRGDNDVYHAMQANPQHTYLILLDGADHAPVDEYLAHGLVQAMKQTAGHFGLRASAVGDVVGGRPIQAAGGPAPPPPPEVRGGGSGPPPRQGQERPPRREADGSGQGRPAPRPSPGQAPDETTFKVVFQDAYLIKSPTTRPIQIGAAGAVVSSPGQWEMERVNAQLYHLRAKHWRGFFWAIKPRAGKAFKVERGMFGQPGGKLTPLKGVKVELR